MLSFDEFFLDEFLLEELDDEDDEELDELEVDDLAEFFLCNSNSIEFSCCKLFGESDRFLFNLSSLGFA